MHLVFQICKYAACLIFIFFSPGAYGSVMNGEKPSARIQFEENKNQWPLQVRYKVAVGSGITLFMEKDRFTYVKYNPDQLNKIHDASHEKEKGNGIKKGAVDLHAFQMIFSGSNPNVQISAFAKQVYYHNYFIGNDSSKWASEVGLFTRINYTGIYPGIDLTAYGQPGSEGTHTDEFKYDFNVGPGADPMQIKMYFDGADKLLIENNTLIIKTSTGDIIENDPYTFQFINGVKHEVKCSYILSSDGKTVSFLFPLGYNPKFPLTIDPAITGASYSGTPQFTDTYGHCAAYDAGGNIYTGGECFNSGYPTTLGAFQTNFAGAVDIVISKLNPNASSLLWATYIGGTDMEIPNSLFVPSNGELYLLGVSSSNDYPTSAGCFDNSYNGMADIVVTHLNSTGTALVGSTFVGGNSNDGSDLVGGWVPWGMNSHDAMRGEIIIDASGNAYVASYTSSQDFPVTSGSYDQTLGGAWDGCVFKLPPNLSSLQWSTFLGGSSEDGSYALRLNSAGEVYVTGCTTSNNFPASAGAYDPSFNGTTDGYITRFNSSGSAILSSTYFGTPQAEISYFVDLDVNSNVYIYGISEGDMPVTAGVYTNPGSHNFVSKFNPGLTTLVLSTVFGDGSSSYLEPEAFMVDNCENVYLSGFSSTPGYPVTANALHATQPTIFDDCYFFVLSKDALTQLYGSFYFGWHVDGGTSRFDPSGTIYQGICIGSGAASTPSWAWKNNLSAPAWDMFVVKIEFQVSGVNAIASAAPNDTLCAGGTVNFANTSNGVDYSWDFGDGSTLDPSTTPAHTYTTAGTFTVTLIAIDSSSCIIADTAFLTITVLPAPVVLLGNDTIICSSPNIALNAGNPGLIHQWSTGANTQIIQVTSAGTYWVNVTNGFCSTKDTVQIQILTKPEFKNDTVLCYDQPLILSAGTGMLGVSYLWSTGQVTSSITVQASGQYWVELSVSNCTVSDTINVTFITAPVVNIGSDTLLCKNNPIQLNANNTGSTYIWSTGQTTQTINVTIPGIYWVNVSLGSCKASDSILVQLIPVAELGTVPSLCETLDTLVLTVENHPNTSYQWSTGDTTSTTEVVQAGVYWVEVITNNCKMQDTVEITGDLGGGSIYFPNSFTPNNDGLNEYFTGYGIGATFFNMKIFDRWGTLVFETNDILAGWDGRIKDNDSVIQEDVYVCVVDYKTECTKDRTIRKIGHVSVIK